MTSVKTNNYFCRLSIESRKSMVSFQCTGVLDSLPTCSCFWVKFDLDWIVARQALPQSPRELPLGLVELKNLEVKSLLETLPWSHLFALDARILRGSRLMSFGILLVASKADEVGTFKSLQVLVGWRCRSEHSKALDVHSWLIPFTTSTTA